MNIEKIKAYLRLLAPLVLAALLVVLPFFYRGGEYWWLPTALFLSLICIFLWFVTRAILGHQAHYGDFPIPTPRWEPLCGVFLLAILYALFQHACWGRFLIGLIPPHHVAAIRSGSISLHSTATWERMLLILSALCVFYFTRNFCRHRRYVRWVLWAIVISATLDALVGLFQLISSDAAAKCIFTPLTADGAYGTVRGVFLNRNHFGFHLSLGIGALFGLFMSSVDGHHEDRTSDGKKGRARKNILFVVLLFLLYAAELVSLSRGGFISTHLVILILGICWLTRKRHHGDAMRHRTGLAMTAIFTAAVICSLPFVLERISNRFHTLLEDDGISSDARVAVWKSSCRLIGDYWVTGVGMGAYGDAIQAYAIPELNQARIDHAHNDYLEMLSELGVPMTVILLGLLGYALYRACRRVKGVHDSTRRYFAWACLAILIGAAVHEFFDYNLQAYPNALAIAAILGVLLALCADSHEIDRQKHVPHWVPMLWAAGALVLMVPTVRWFYHSVGRHRLWLVQQPQYHPRGQSAVPPSERMMLAQRIHEQSPHDPRVLQSYVREIIESGKKETNRYHRRQLWNHVIDLETELIGLRPASYEAWETRGIVRYATGDFLGGLDDLEHAMALAPTLLQPRLLAAQYYNQAAIRLHNVEYVLRAERIQRGILASHPESGRQFLPQLLTIDTPYRELIQNIHPTQELGFDILAILLKQHRFEEALDCLGRIPDWIPSDKHDPVETRLHLAEYHLLLANVLGQTTKTELAEYLSALAEFKLWQDKLEGATVWKNPEAHLEKLSEQSAGALPCQRLEAARAYLLLAKNADAVQALMPLVYPGQPYPPSEEERAQALRLLQGIPADVRSHEGFQLEALRALLERDEDRLRELKEIYQGSEQDASNQSGIAFHRLSWLNAQLLDVVEAQSSAPEDIIGFLEDAAQVVAIEVEPAVFTNPYETLTVTVRLRVQNGTRKGIEPMLRLSTPLGDIATVKLVPVEARSSLLWKAGEELVFRAEISNCLTQASIRGIPMSEISSVTAEVLQNAQKSSSPPCLRLIKVNFSRK